MSSAHRTEEIVLSDLTPIGSGGDKAVYQDPRAEDQLLKVALARPELAPPRGVTALAAGMNVDTHRRKIMKEIHEYLRVGWVHDTVGGVMPITRFMGFVATDMGIGFVTEKIADARGNAGQTVSDVARERDLTDAEIDAMSVFGEGLVALNVRASDLSSSNIVLGHRGVVGAQGPLEAVLVDGFGDTHVIPVRTWSKRINVQATHRRLARIARSTRLRWDEATLRFTRSDGAPV